jgi:hypothetical protein
MAKKKFTQLPAADSLSGTEVIAVVQDGVSKKATISQVSVGASSSLPLEWDLVAEAGYPADLTKMYYSTDATESIYPVGTLFWSNGGGGWYTK